MNSSGKVLTIFVVIIAILLISLTAISLFFFQKETERRKLAETSLEEYLAEKGKLEGDLKEIKKQNFLLQEKNKEADERINDLSDDLELEKGLREEMKLEAATLQEKMDAIVSEKEGFDEKIKASEEKREELAADLERSKQKIKELEVKLKAEVGRAQKLGTLYEQKQEEMSVLERTVVEQKALSNRSSYLPISGGRMDGLSGKDPSGKVTSLGVELQEIVVVPGEGIGQNMGADILLRSSRRNEAVISDRSLEGRILSVDVETEFVIISLGEMDGIEIGDIFAVFRENDFVGDLKITRLQPEMAAADLIVPFSISNVKKNDQIRAKR